MTCDDCGRTAPHPPEGWLVYIGVQGGKCPECLSRWFGDLVGGVDADEPTIVDAREAKPCCDYSH